jgi:hypothetical protein
LRTGIPGIDDDQYGEKCSQPDKEHADAVDGEMVADAQGRHPASMFGELHGGGVRHEAHQHEAGQGQFHEGDTQCRRLEEIFVFDQPEHRRAREREEDQIREDRESKTELFKHCVSRNSAASA